MWVLGLGFNIRSLGLRDTCIHVYICTTVVCKFGLLGEDRKNRGCLGDPVRNGWVKKEATVLCLYRYILRHSFWLII